MSRLFLMRHGESVWNVEYRLQGQGDPVLSEAGREQGRTAAAAVAELPPASVLASDLKRARETAALAGHPDAPTDERWRERNLGEWQGQLEDDLDPKDMAAFRTGKLVPSGAEPWETFQARVAGAARELAERGGDWLLFTHGGCVRALIAELTGGDWRAVAGPENGSLSIVRLGSQPRVLVFNWMPSVPGLGPDTDPGATVEADDEA